LEVPTLGPGLETPFGPGQIFIVHRVQSGESLGVLATRFKTTIEVLRKANGLLAGISLQVNTDLVIPLGQTEAENVPEFLVLLLDQDELVGGLAANYPTNVTDLRRYNSLGPGDRIPAGRWILIPVED
jgi:hypothetical protein